MKFADDIQAAGYLADLADAFPSLCRGVPASGPGGSRRRNIRWLALWPALWRHLLLSPLILKLLPVTHVTLRAVAAQQQQQKGQPCWVGTFFYMKEDCCNTKFGPRGRKTCWDGDFSFERCCQEEAPPPTGFVMRSPNTNWIEDAFEVESFHKVGERVLLVKNGVAEEVFLHRGDFASQPGVRVDFATQTRVEVSRVQQGVNAADIGVAIYVHKVPECSGHLLLEEVHAKWTAKPIRGTWDSFRRQQVEHLHALDNAVMNSGVLTEKPDEATLFYVPAFWSLLIENMMDIHSGYTDRLKKGEGGDAARTMFSVEAQTTGLECISRTFEQLRTNPFYLRNAAYDHFWVAGIQHPFNPIPSQTCQIETYDPFAKNMIVMASGVRDYGFADVLFEWSAPLYGALQRIFVPYSTAVHCRHLEALANSPRKRPLAVTFVGSPTSRVRNWALELSKEAEFARDRRAAFRFGIVDEVQAASRGEQGDWEDTGNTTRLYQKTDFCLVMPGHLHDMTKRCYDSMAQGCLPVVVTKQRFWMALPFPGQIPWKDFATFKRVASVDEMRTLLRELLHSHEYDQESLRKRRQALARSAGLFAVHDESGCSVAERSAFSELLVKELKARQAVWPHIRTSWLFDD